ncbi:FAD-dependent oxidoreductase [Mesobacterium pallidum]|uniref:FAD-dependent oxidoreductase n=1 Tax=Mesobacterium pallidum TaxID=2872037 RepID=UPI001EE19174|nr:FAD-dependent oxidoreductase [Mesobacterium pallidum]
MIALEQGTIHQPARDLPLAYTADVVVVGAGPSGFAAALKAARMGASVVVVDKLDMPGGVHTSGLQGHAGEGIGGIHSELMERFAAHGYIYRADARSHANWAGNPLSHYERRKRPGDDFIRLSFNPEGSGSVMAQMLHEAGAHALYDTRFVDCITAEGRIEAIVVENNSGRFAISGKIFVDGSGTGLLAAAAGVPYVSGGGGQPDGSDWDGIHRPVPGGLLWTLHGVDLPALTRHQDQARDPLLQKVIAEARAAGDIPEGLYRPEMAGENVYASMYIGHPTLDMSPMAAPGTYCLWQNVPYELGLHMDESGEDNSLAMRFLRGFIDAEARFLKKYVPGFDKSTIGSVGRYVGVRDGRHPVGEHVFTLDDAREGRVFADAVTEPMTKPFYWDRYTPYTFTVPYRCFLPKKVDNLLLAGASLSFTYETLFMVMRNFPWTTLTGEIAGFAAARCIERKIGPKELDWTAPYGPGG